jgi:hypothetical protein
MKRLLALGLLVVLAGCTVPGSLSDSGDAVSGELGVEDGYRYNESIAVTPDDGLNESELNAVVGRSMARLEVIRELEFTGDVNVSIISRAEYQENQPFGGDETGALWNNQVWEGLFIVGEDRDIDDVFNSTLGGAVLGYYEPGTGNIVIVSDSETPKINRNTLVHELVHALQDQQFALDESPPTQDRQLAKNGVVEGEANLLEDRYQQRCENEWDCVTVSTGGASGGSSNVDRGLLRVILYPYVVGPTFVDTIESEGGWEAVNELHEDYPTSTEQVSNPSLYPEEEPVTVSVPDRSNGDWERFDHDPVADTVGAASMYVMFADNGVIEGGNQYQHPATEGWAGDSLVPYRNGDQYGYVWQTVWDTEKDARQFHEAYRDLLARYDATRDGNVYTIPESSPYGDAFRVVRDGTRVRIVNAPSVDALSAIHG